MSKSLEKKHILYLVGGRPRTGKTKIANEMERRSPLIRFSTDAIRSIIRNVVVGETSEAIEKVTFQGVATFRRADDAQLHEMPIERNNMGEDDLAWLGAAALIRAHDRTNQHDVLIEGVAIMPEKVHELKLNNFRVKPIFIGYNSTSYAASILDFSKREKDYLFYELQQKNMSDEEYIKTSVLQEVQNSIALKQRAESFGYKYFDAAQLSFEEHVKGVVRYLLED